MAEYISKTKFEELMRKKARNNFDLYYADKSKRYHANAIGYTIAADEAHVFPASDVKPVNQWISVDDKLPATRKTVLIYDEYEGVSAGYYDSDYAKFRSIDDVYRPCNVTHWQPLPEPPKDGDPE
jgi:hypothetical protein